jgi:hypothetical protein
MSAAVVRVLVEDHLAYLHGDGRLIDPAIRAARAWRRYDERRRAIKIKASDLDNVLAAIELRNGGDVRTEVVR